MRTNAPLLLLVLLAGCASAPETTLLPNRGTGSPLDPRAAIAARYAPFCYAATDPVGGRQDVISNVDFDGDLVGRNDWANLDRFRLRPTVYFSVLETDTHWFIAYHLFHPRDWCRVRVFLNEQHENDGENLEVVARKSDGRVVLLWTQAHYRGRVHSNDPTVRSGKVDVAGPFQTVDDLGRPDPRGTHAAVFVEARGHGIHATLGGCSRVTVEPTGAWRFRDRSGVLFRPARAGEVVDEPAGTTSGEAPYALESTTTKLWPLLAAGELSGDGRLLDGAWTYRGARGAFEVPRFYDAARCSGPFGTDRGISPFAIDVCWKEGTLGALFFDPARRWSEVLELAGPWSLDYVDYPFAR